MKFSCSPKPINPHSIPIHDQQRIRTARPPTGREPPKRLPKCQTPNNIKSRQIEPHHQIRPLLPTRINPQLLHKQIHNLAHQILLRLETPVAKRMTKILPHLPMHRRIPLADNAMRHARKTAAVVEGALDEGAVTLTEAVDVFPAFHGRERELIGGGADDGPVFFVQSEDVVWLAAAEEPVGVQYIGPGSQRRSWEAVEGMLGMAPVDEGGEYAEELLPVPPSVRKKHTFPFPFFFLFFLSFLFVGKRSDERRV